MTTLSRILNRRNNDHTDYEFPFRFVFLFLLALAVCVINALKPLHIDDTVYYWMARQILSNPFDPFGFEILWDQWPGFVDMGYIPPVMPYWLAASLWVFGDNPILIKLSMLPFILVFVVSTHLLARRFSPSVALPVTVFIAVSPATLPGWNIMLDLPSIALGLMAIELFIRATSNNNWKYVLAAASLAALAVLTKYTALVIPGVMLLYAVLSRRWFMGIAAGLIVLAFVIAWEFFHFYQYGHTQLLWSIMQGSNNNGEFSTVSFLSSAVLMILGALITFVSSVYFPLRTINKTFIGIVLTFLILGFAGYAAAIYSGPFELWFTILGCLLFAVILLGLVVEVFLDKDKFKFTKPSANIYLFLLGWLILEIIGYFLMSLFPAVRRLITISIVLSFLGFRLLDSKISPETRKMGLIGCWMLVAGNIAVTSLYVIVDYKEANAQKTLAYHSVKHIRQSGGEGSIWYTGHWGFAYYADKAGMKAVIPDRSMLKANDWVVIPDRVDAQDINTGAANMTYMGSVNINDQIPIHTVVEYYSGKMPLAVKPDPDRLRGHVFQVRKDHVARSKLTFNQVVNYIHNSADRRAAVNALPALLYYRHQSHAPLRVLLVNTVGLFNELASDTAPVIAEMATDNNTAVKVAVMDTLAKLGNRTPVVIAAIRARLEDPAAEVREAAETSLRILYGGGN